MKESERRKNLLIEILNLKTDARGRYEECIKEDSNVRKLNFTVERNETFKEKYDKETASNL